MKFRSLVCAVLGLAMAGSVLAQAQTPEELIKLRQGSFRVIGWHCAKVKANLDGQYNKDEVLAASTVIQSVVNAGLSPLFAPGTDKGVGFHESKAKADAVDPARNAKLGEIASQFRKDANELVKVASTGNKDAIRAQFGNLTKNCKACHDEYRIQ